jgi:hypothetical protein
VLKKAGIVVAAAATGLLALSPLAFAGEHHEAPAPVNHTNVESGNVTNDCDFGQQGPQVDQTLTGGSSLLGAADLVTGAVAPVTAQTQAGNCTNVNVSDVVDSDSNNTTETVNRTRVEDSFNTSTSGDDDDPFGPGFPFN